MNVKKNTPLGVTQIYNPADKTTQISWSYLEDAGIEYFVLEFWDDHKNKWTPYDGKAGILEKK